MHSPCQLSNAQIIQHQAHTSTTICTHTTQWQLKQPKMQPQASSLRSCSEIHTQSERHWRLKCDLAQVKADREKNELSINFRDYFWQNKNRITFSWIWDDFCISFDKLWFVPSTCYEPWYRCNSFIRWACSCLSMAMQTKFKWLVSLHPDRFFTRL